MSDGFMLQMALYYMIKRMQLVQFTRIRSVAILASYTHHMSRTSSHHAVKLVRSATILILVNWTSCIVLIITRMKV